MASALAAELPTLPLVLWETPPGLELALAQEGVAFVTVRDPHPLAFGAGRFVLFDGRRIGPGRVAAVLPAGHVAIDVDALRRGEPFDPFAALVDNRSAPATWHVGGRELTERVALRPKGAIRRRLLGRLREAVMRAGGLWARLAPYPHPYRSVFGFRVDLDEPEPADYDRFARGRTPLEDCTTHFLNTHAYGELRGVLADLRGRDVQSHGHFHHVYRDPEANRRNVERAHEILLREGFAPGGFAAPGGRWNAGLDRALEAFGYDYSSDFGIGYDDLPFFPWLGDRFSAVLQVPIHPICEGLFLEAGARGGRPIADHLVGAVRRGIAAGEPALVYGHPERRLARFAWVLAELARAVAGEELLWRATLTEFARWWRVRGALRWAVVPRGEGRYEVQFDDWDSSYPLALEVVRGAHVASIPVPGPRMPLNLGSFVFERRAARVDRPEPTPARRPFGVRAALRSALDWETVTPIDELPTNTIAAGIKKRLRRWRSGDGR